MSLTDLMRAAWNGDLEGVKRNLNQVGMKDENGWTALMEAAIWGHANCIPLLEKEIGMQDNWGWTALMWAARNGETDCVRLLLSEAGKQTTKERDDFPPGTTALMIAARENYPEIVQLLLPYEQGLTDSNSHTAQWHGNNGDPKRGDFTQVRKLLENEGTERLPPPKEQPSLMASAITGDIEGVKKHLDRVGYQDPTGTTALMLAASYGHSDCIPFLEREIGMRNNYGTTALMRAAINGRTKCIPLLMNEAGKQKDNGWTALMLAASNGHSDCIPLLKKEIGMQCNIGQTALMKAALTGKADCVPLLKEEVGKKNKIGTTALMFAAKNGRSDCIPLLEEEVGMQNSWGWTALMYAARDGKTDCARLLLSEAGRQSTKERETTLNDTKLTFPSGTTALMFAAHYNHPEIVELLLPFEQGITDSNGRIAHWHANNGDPNRGDFTQVRELLEYEDTKRDPPPPKGALMLLASAMTGDVEGVRRNLSHTRYQDPTGKTALMLAAEKGRVNCIPLLEKEIGMRNNDGWTALMLAAYNGNADCVKVLLSEAGKQTTSKLGSFFPGTTALMIAARRNHPEVVNLLLPYEQGLRDFKGRTAKWYADNSSEEKDFSQVRKLLKNEDTNRLSPPPKEALMLSFFAMKGDVEGVRKYVSHAGYQDSNGMTALMKAAMVGHSNCISILEREIGMRDNDGRTALMLVASNGKMDCAQILLPEAGKQTTKEWDSFPSGMTALMIAAYFNHPDVVKLLLPYEQGMRNSEEHAAKWYAYNGKALRGHYSQIHELLEYEGLERIPPPTHGAANRRGVKKLSSSRSLPEGMTCVICLTNPKDTLLQPCKHLCTCSGCSSRLKGQPCPLCRTPVESTVKVYL
ncbi:Ankyrin repeat protein 2 [Giardia muris]|uniref:Ankyrin repeat protein 2 n=1 Tax=Giardia muris TaxID=5742 RepID=A0A4Z1T507_GIAMU|nr:Ankyrin repeat protein 2 [Giardia muris]|eukprot:TNJ30758.1 Ankyrin repeat protein 2 [Giardia muris]